MPGIPATRDLARSIDRLRRLAEANHHRRLVIIAGHADWCRAAASAALEGRTRLWIGTTAGNTGHALPAGRARTLLGGEWHGAVYDAHEGLDVDALAAVTGTLRGGSLLLLLTPPLAVWPSIPDPALARLLNSPATPADAAGRFVSRLAGTLRTADGVTICAEGAPLPPVPQPLGRISPRPVPAADGALGADQRRAVAAVVAAIDAPPVVLIADRGRGKSAALGLAAARLLQGGTLRIVVTAPRRAAAAALFGHAASRLGLRNSHGDLHAPGGGSLCFVAPDRLVREPPVADLVLVDEAAAIPAPLLDRLLRQSPRIAFATTVHGYEGTGRGFALRFRASLDRLTPGWREITLETPVRWAANDPLEAWLNTALLLDAEPASTTPEPGVPRCVRLDRDALLDDEDLLRELFGLLIQAHYRTTPADLRQLLDAPSVSIHVAYLEKTPVGVAVCIDEGRLDAETAFAVWTGRRRVRGHLVAQSLASHAGLHDAPRLGYRRVQRIAVLPGARRHGIGHALLASIASAARDDGLDLVATSYGMTPDLVEFWHACGFTSARVGLRREASSGAHALMMLRPLTRSGETLVATARRRLAQALSALLQGPLADLEAPLVELLRARLPWADADRRPTPEDWDEAAAFAFARRGPDAAFAPLRRVTQTLLEELSRPPDPVLAALGARFVDAVPWSGIVGELGCAGRAAAIEQMRAGLRHMLTARHDPMLSARITRLQGTQDACPAETDAPR